MVALTVCYKSGLRFDADYYFAKHVPLATTNLGRQGMKRVEVRKILGTPAGAPAPYQIITTVYFEDAATVQRALESAGGQAVVADIKNYRDGTPDLMIGEVLA